MTEPDLHQHICGMAGMPAKGSQPPFAEVAFPLHPDTPIDYEAVRAAAVEKILGPCDYVLHPAVGAPHVDVYRYPPSVNRPFWCYVTNGMSDFPQVLPDQSLFRSELICATRSEARTAADLLTVLGTMPFRDATFLHLYHTVPFPDGIGDPRFTYVMTIPPFLVEDLVKVAFLGQPLVVMSIIRITAEERQRAAATSSRQVVNSLPDDLETWLLDGRGGGALS